MRRIFSGALALSVFFMSIGFAEEEEAILSEQNSFTDKPSDFSKNITAASEVIKKKKKSPLLAVTLSSIPGLGHVYLGDLETAGTLFGSSALGYALCGRSLESGLIAIQNNALYGTYAAYRDARIYNAQEGYKYTMPTESFFDLVKAPFEISVLKKPEVWGGLIGCLAIGSVMGYLIDLGENQAAAFVKATSPLDNISPFMAFPVGIGEEAYFRGFLQPCLSEASSPVGGIILSSLLFGAAHIPNGDEMDDSLRRKYYTYGIPYLTAFGAYAGWLTYKNQSLKESVALHSWYDFVIFLAESTAKQSAMIKEPKFAVSFRF